VETILCSTTKSGQSDKIAPVGGVSQQTGESLLEVRQSNQHAKASPLDSLHQGRGIEIGLRILDGQDEGRSTLPCQQITHDKGTGSMVAFDVELRLAEDMDIDTCRPPPYILSIVALQPFRQSADPAAPVAVEALLGRGDVPGEVLATVRVGSAEHKGVELEEAPGITKPEEIDPACKGIVDSTVPRHQVVADLVRHGVARSAEGCVDSPEISLDGPQGRIDLGEVEGVLPATVRDSGVVKRDDVR
jgi:hypothetical protein